MKFFNAVIVTSQDGEKTAKAEFRDPVKALFHIFMEMSDEDRQQVAAIGQETQRIIREKSDKGPPFFGVREGTPVQP